MESGYYIEQVFPLYGVRFISVSDHYDSADHDGGTGGLDIAFKFIMHEHYSRDLSKKVKSAKHVLMKNGEHIVGNAIYGYRKNDAGKWEQDPPAAKVVGEIFNMAIGGKTTAQIRDKLFADLQPAPREYENMKRGMDVTPKFMWTTQQIWRMLTNEQYAGIYIAGKHESTHIGSKAMRMKDRSEWIIIPDSHPTIVSKEDFSKTQELLKAPKDVLSTKDRERSRQSKKLFKKMEDGNGKYNANLYGYRMNASGSWDIDETAADVVRTIFNMALDGYSPRETANRLRADRHVPPKEYFQFSRGKDVEVTYRWPTSSIRRILKEEQYTGTYVVGRTFQDEDGHRHQIPESEWIVIPDKHPAIVSKELFEQAQAVISQGKRKMQPHNHLLRGKVVCGCCNRAMIYGSTTLQPMYRCMSTHADPTAACHKYTISTTEVEDAVMSIMKIQAGVILGTENFADLRKVNGDICQLGEHEKQITHFAEQRQAVYEQFVTGEIDRESYRATKAALTAQIDRLKNIAASIKQSELDSHAKKAIIEQAESVLGDTLTQREIVDALIEKVHVFPNSHLEIKWKVAGFSAV